MGIQATESYDETENSSKAMCSFYGPNIAKLQPLKSLDFEEITDYVRHDKRLEIATEKVRATDDHKEQGKRKCNLLPFITGSGTFSKRSKEGLIESNDCVVLDFDYTDNPGYTPVQMRRIILGIEQLHSFHTMISPSAKGLKAVVKINFALYETLGIDRADAIHALIFYIAFNFVLIADKACIDIARATFLCHDETATYDRLEPYCALELKPWFDKYKESTGKSGKIVLKPKDKSVEFDETPQQAEEHLRTVASRIDRDIIGNSYYDFLRLVFSLTNAGDTGRDILLHCCSYYSDTQQIDPGELFDKLSKISNVRATLGTFYKMCKDAGIDISMRKRQTSPTSDGNEDETFVSVKDRIMADNMVENLSYFSDEVINDLPPILYEHIRHFKKIEERMMMTMADITAASACFPGVHAFYGDTNPRTVESNLYTMCIAPAGSGKGKVQDSRLLVEPIHDLLYARSKKIQGEYDAKMKAALEKSGKKDNVKEELGERPVDVSFIMAPDSTSSSLKMRLYNNGGRGFLAATEMSAFGVTANQDYGLMNPTFLNMAFMHEKIHWERRGDNHDKPKNIEAFDIKNPCLSVLFTGTLDQVEGVIASNANGLASRFIKVMLPSQKKFINQWNHDKADVEEQRKAITALADRLQIFWIKLECMPDGIELHYTEEQGNYVTEFFNNNFKKYSALYGDNFNAIVMRMGLIHMRICMILTMLRQTSIDDLDKWIVFSDTDVKNALRMICVLMEHSALAYRLACDKKPAEFDYKALPEAYSLNAILPETFTTNDAMSLGRKLGMSKRSVQRWLKEASDNDSEMGLWIKKIKHGTYKKLDHDLYTSLN